MRVLVITVAQLVTLQLATAVLMELLMTVPVMATAVQSHGSVMVLRIVKTRHTAVT